MRSKDVLFVRYGTVVIGPKKIIGKNVFATVNKVPDNGNALGATVVGLGGGKFAAKQTFAAAAAA